MARKTAHEMIMQLRDEMGIPEEITTPEEDAYFEAKRQAAKKRADLAGTEENYVRMFGRDPWTDRLLDQNQDDVDPFMPSMSKTAKKIAEKNSDQVLWRNKYTGVLPTLHLPKEAKESKAVKKARKKRKKYEDEVLRQNQINIAYWWLECFLNPKESDKLYRKYYNDLDGLIDLCYEWAMDWSEAMTYQKEDRGHTFKQIEDKLIEQFEEREALVDDVGGMKFHRREYAERERKQIKVDPYTNRYPDIPDYLWMEFEHYCDQNPIKKFKKKAKEYGPMMSAAGMRRICFLKEVNKKNKAWRNHMLLHDPLTGASFVSEEKMRANIKKKLAEYDAKRKEFVKMLDKLVDKGAISTEYAEHVMGDTKLVRDRVRKRWEEEIERAKVRQKEDERLYKKQKRTYDARKKWFEKYGADIHDNAFFVVDEEDKITVKSTKQKSGKMMYKVETGDGTTNYSEGSLLDAMDIRVPPSPPAKPKKPKYDKGYWEDYEQLPAY